MVGKFVEVCSHGQKSRGEAAVGFVKGKVAFDCSFCLQPSPLVWLLTFLKSYSQKKSNQRDPKSYYHVAYINLVMEF
jgi:hypothetical protein